MIGIGDYLGAQAEDTRVVKHFFAAHISDTRMAWSVTVARASRARVVTVDEVVLLPGDGALLARMGAVGSSGSGPGDVDPWTR